MSVVFAGRLFCECALYGSIYTGSLDQLTRASQHVTVQICYASKTIAGYHCFHLSFDVSLTKLHCHDVTSIFFLVWVWSLLVDCLVQ